MSVNRQEIGIDLRPMQELDLYRILKIEQGAYRYPWSKGVFQDCLRTGYCCWVIEEQMLATGYGIMQVIADEAHVLNLCVDPERQGAGLGRRLLRKLMQIATGHYAQNMILEVRPTNKTAINLYYSEGFTQIGRRSKYYPNHKQSESGEIDSAREDALVLGRPLDSGFNTVFPMEQR